MANAAKAMKFLARIISSKDEVGFNSWSKSAFTPPQFSPPL
jgi:hypothetical protein